MSWPIIASQRKTPGRNTYKLPQKLLHNGIWQKFNPIKKCLDRQTWAILV